MLAVNLMVRLMFSTVVIVCVLAVDFALDLGRPWVWGGVFACLSYDAFKTYRDFHERHRE
jgi:hypothetical protein